jgi:Transposase
MSVYVGIDVHRNRSQVAVVAEDGKVQLNKNVVNGSEPFLRLIGDLPSGTPVAFEAAFGWSWLADLLEDYGFEAHLVHPLRCKAIASARLKNDKVDAAILAQLLRADLLPEAWIAPAKVRQLRAVLRHRISLVRLGTQLRNRIHAVAADHGYDRPASYWTGPGRGWLAELDLPAASREIITDALAVTGRPGAADRPARRRAAPARQGRPAGQGADHAAGRRGVHRAGHGGRDRRHQPVPQRPQAGVVGRADPDRARLGPEGPARAHLQAGLSLAAVGAQPGRADRQAVPGLRRQLRGPREKAREEDRHHRDRPQAADPRLPPAGQPARYQHQHAGCPRGTRRRSPTTGRVAKPRARSPQRHEQAAWPRSIT